MDYAYAAPGWFKVNSTNLRRVLVVSSCQLYALEGIVPNAEDGCEIDLILGPFGCVLPETPPRPVEDYDLQILQIPLRALAAEGITMGLEYNDIAGHEAVFERAVAIMAMHFENGTKWAREAGLLTFVPNFLVPQQNSLGRLLPRYDLRNPVFFVESLNKELHALIDKTPNTYIIDIYAISTLFGRRYIQDDSIMANSHGSALTDYGQNIDAARIEHPGAILDIYNNKSVEFYIAIWREIIAMYRTIRQIDAIKLVVIDLDDTLWRGVIAEGEDITSDHTEGWPTGFAEALSFLRRRGVVLAILSKNDPERIEQLWEKIYGGRLKLEDFAIRKISWRPKAEAMAEILEEASLLPRSTLYIDDNPAERAQISAAFPDIRTMGGSPYHWRRALLWAPELQVANISQESARRTEMIQAQVKRETARKSFSREDFLASLNLTTTISTINSTNDSNFGRAFELINKTNQFNTTGDRWTYQQMHDAIKRGVKLKIFDASDIYTRYGVVGVVIMDGDVVQQIVMSCRVIGLGVEQAILGTIFNALFASGVRVVKARLKKTDANGPALSLWPSMGFDLRDNIYELNAQHISLPTHVKIVMNEQQEDLQAEILTSQEENSGIASPPVSPSSEAPPVTTQKQRGGWLFRRRTPTSLGR